MAQQAIVVNKKDNVATALQQLEKGDSVIIEIDNVAFEVLLSQPVQFGHKFALDNIEQGNAIIKYGEKIGIASLKITQGEHVHLHNVEGFRGRGDKI
jgi:altronate dehydratase small subunit